MLQTPSDLPHSSEGVRADFDPTLLGRAREQTWEAIQRIASGVEVGMLESRARERADEILKSMGATRFWHRTHVRFGVNTLKSFAEESLPGVRLQQQDIFFLDLGPVWDGYEGDAGASFTVGGDSDMLRCAQDAKTLFGLVRNRWVESGDSGKALYAFAVEEARAMGWEFLLAGASGHRISDFPHRLYHRGALEQATFRPAAERWILEIQLRHPTRSFGAFFEDVLM